MLGVARRGYVIDDATIKLIKEDASRRGGHYGDPRALFRAAGVL